MKNVKLEKVLEIVCLALSVLYMLLSVFKGEHAPLYIWSVYGICLAIHFKGEE